MYMRYTYVSNDLKTVSSDQRQNRDSFVLGVSDGGREIRGALYTIRSGRDPNVSAKTRENRTHANMDFGVYIIYCSSGECIFIESRSDSRATGSGEYLIICVRDCLPLPPPPRRRLCKYAMNRARCVSCLYPRGKILVNLYAAVIGSVCAAARHTSIFIFNFHQQRRS